MSLILSLETSGRICSVAIHRDAKLIATLELHIDQSHASKLAVLIDEVKKLAGIELNQLDAVAISSGPGSYTGLRIGTSTGKGLCFSLKIPLIAVGSLDLLAFQVNKYNVQRTFLCPMIDARRMEVYCMVTDSSLKYLQPVEAKIIDELSFKQHLDKNSVLFFGDGSDKCRDIIKHTNANFVSGVYPRASDLGSVASRKFEKSDFEDLVNFEPYYLKEFILKVRAEKV